MAPDVSNIDFSGLRFLPVNYTFKTCQKLTCFLHSVLYGTLLSSVVSAHEGIMSTHEQLVRITRLLISAYKRLH